MRPVQTAYFDTAGGWVGVAATSVGLVALNLPVSTREAAVAEIERLLPADCTEVGELTGSPFDAAALARLGTDLVRYFQGQKVEFDCPIDWEGCAYTPFQEKALRACHQVGYGEAVTYGDLARSIGHPKASRAIGMAMHINRVSLVVP